jgi:hypothetical protein
LTEHRWYETEASRLRGRPAYFRSEDCYEEEAYYNGWIDKPLTARQEEELTQLVRLVVARTRNFSRT